MIELDPSCLGLIRALVSTEQIIAHLTVLGWWPVEVERQAWRGPVKTLAIYNGRQYFYQLHHRIDVGYFVRDGGMVETEWWRFPDDTLRKLVLTVDSQGIGGWGGE